MKHQHIVILCGGEGKRLWPLAKPEHPKQFLQWTENTTLFDETVNRIQPFLDAGAQLHVVTQKKYRHFFSAYENKITTFFEEDMSRNTAPAILYALDGIIEQDFEACVTFMPADHYVKSTDLFVESFALFLAFLEKEDALCMMGVKPTYAATEYGYIEMDEHEAEFKKVKQFYEKPSKNRAEILIQNPAMLWNIGIYGSKATVFLEEFLAHAPLLVDEMKLYKENKISYNELTHISFDYAVAEKSQRLKVLPFKSEWSDVGSLDVFLNLSPSALLYKAREKVYFEGLK
jgi:mannose-1-phosphate guanylyltransferase